MKKNLAWQGVSFKDKTILMQNVLKRAEQLEKAGKNKDAKLIILSTCIDVLQTANAIEKSIDWKRLEKECVILVQGIVRQLEKQPTTSWSTGDFDVLATAIMIQAKGNKKMLLKSEKLIKKGIQKAKQTKNNNAELLLQAKLIKISIEENNFKKVVDNIKILFVIRGNNKVEPKTLTRIYRTTAEGFKYLAIKTAKDAKLHNQVLKAENI